MKYRDRPTRVRVRICLVAFLLGFAALTARVWQLQLIMDQRVNRVQNSQGDHAITLSAQRGSIFDAKGRELAVSLKVPSIFANPKVTELSKKSMRQLAGLLGIPLNQLETKLRNTEKQFVWLKRQVAPEVGKTIEELNLPGIAVTTEWARLYPSREMAAQLVGVVGMDGEGLEGVERYFDKFLRSRPLVIRLSRDGKGRAIYTGNVSLKEPDRGASLYLTLDATIQHVLEDELVRAAIESGSKTAMGVVMDPSDGRILAMASYPSVNPNRLDRTAAESWRNRPLEEVFEPGSTFKVFTVAAALEANVLNPKQFFNCQKGSLVIGGKMIHNTHEHAWLDPAGIIKFSNNTGAARIGLLVGRDRLMQTISVLGFGQRTGIDFPGEERGLLLKPGQWRDLETANVSFGQGIGVTAIQLVSALSTLANGGFAVHPRVVERATLADGQEINFAKTYQPTRILRTETTQHLHQWMESVTESDGTGPQAAMAEYSVAGKTGTAQMIDPATGKYSSQLVTSSFMGYAPTTHPKLAAIMVFREPRHADYGGTLAAPVFRRVVSAALSYLGVTPDKIPEKNESPLLEAKIGKSERSKEVASAVARKGDLGSLPDFRGLSIREVLKLAREFSLNISVIGSGVAVRQESERTPAGRKEASLRVYFGAANPKERT